jgi:hypothetical protein
MGKSETVDEDGGILDHQPVRLAYQPPASSTFLSEQTSHQQTASSTFLSEQTSTSHQPPAGNGKKKGHRFFFFSHVALSRILVPIFFMVGPTLYL